MELPSQETLAIIGLATIVLVVFFIILLAFGLLFIYFMSKNRRIVRFLSTTVGAALSRLLMFILDLLYVPTKKITSLLGGNEKIVDFVNIEMRNMILKKRFSYVPYEERVILLPQCLRSLECPASFSSVEGAKCVKCGKCKICKIAEKAEALGYKGAYIAPGGGFVRRIIEKVKPKAVIGIGCPFEVHGGLLEMSSKGIPVQGVVLLDDGCVETDVVLDEIFKVMELYENGA